MERTVGASQHGTGACRTKSTPNPIQVQLCFIKSESKAIWVRNGQTGSGASPSRSEEDGDTLLTGPIVDQAALYGLLKKIRDLGMPLVSVNCIEPGPTDTSGGRE